MHVPKTKQKTHTECYASRVNRAHLLFEQASKTSKRSCNIMLTMLQGAVTHDPCMPWLMHGGNVKDSCGRNGNCYGKSMP